MMRGLLSPPREGSVASALTFLAAGSAQLITSRAPLSALPKLFPRRRQTFPPGRSARIATLCFMRTPPREGAITLPAGPQMEEPPRLGDRPVPDQVSGTRQRRRFVSELNSSFQRASLAFVSYLHLIPMDHSFVPWIHLAKLTIQGLSVLAWLTERQNSEKIGPPTTDVEPGLGKVE